MSPKPKLGNKFAKKTDVSKTSAEKINGRNPHRPRDTHKETIPHTMPINATIQDARMNRLPMASGALKAFA
jgi:hypothetical protein